MYPAWVWFFSVSMAFNAAFLKGVGEAKDDATVFDFEKERRKRWPK